MRVTGNVTVGLSERWHNIAKQITNKSNGPFQVPTHVDKSRSSSDAIYKELFDELPEDERREWVKRSETEHAEALEKANKNLKSGPPTEPED